MVLNGKWCHGWIHELNTQAVPIIRRYIKIRLCQNYSHLWTIFRTFVKEAKKEVYLEKNIWRSSFDRLLDKDLLSGRLWKMFLIKIALLVVLLCWTFTKNKIDNAKARPSSVEGNNKQTAYCFVLSFWWRSIINYGTALMPPSQSSEFELSSIEVDFEQNMKLKSRKFPSIQHSSHRGIHSVSRWNERVNGHIAKESFDVQILQSNISVYIVCYNWIWVPVGVDRIMYVCSGHNPSWVCMRESRVQQFVLIQKKAIRQSLWLCGLVAYSPACTCKY